MYLLQAFNTEFIAFPSYVDTNCWTQTKATGEIICVEQTIILLKHGF